MTDNSGCDISSVLTALVQKYRDLIARNAKAGIFRALRVEITDAFKCGHTRREIWEALRNAGYQGSYPTFCRGFKCSTPSVGPDEPEYRKAPPSGRERDSSGMTQAHVSAPQAVEGTNVGGRSNDSELAAGLNTISLAYALKLTPDEIRALDWVTRGRVVALRAKAAVEENQRRAAEAAERDKCDFHYDSEKYWEDIKKIYGKVRS